jgi:hypothetical protein
MDTKKKIVKKKIVKKTENIGDVSEFESKNINSIEKLKVILSKQTMPIFNIDIAPKSWVLPNRVKFNTWLDANFKYPQKKEMKQNCEESKEVNSPTVKVDFVNLFAHQSFIKDYIQYSSPYRGLLVYHGLGVGKSCASIAAAELLMNHMDVVVMLPASLRGNYINEIKKCGRRFYYLKQHWSFVQLDVFNTNLDIIKTLKLDIEIVNKNKGLWIPENHGDEANYNLLPSFAQKQIVEQIENIINNKYSFINYNGLKTVNIKEMIKNGNPFDGKCVVIDEIHNMISRIVNGGKIGTAIYKLLMAAKDCKLIMLSGTPIINHPYEISYLINLIVGPKTHYILKAVKTSNFDINIIKEKIDNIENIDYYLIDENARKITIVLLPPGFKYENRKTLEVVRLDKKDVKQDEQIINMIIDSLKKKSINIGKKISTKEFKALPEDEKEFNKYFVDMDSGKIINPKLFSRRILGTVSYYSTYSSKLYPSWDILESNEIMNDFQFLIYEKSRLKEREKESKSKFTKSKGDGNIFNDSGQVYRFYSRANCNFVFPDEIKRPFPSMKYIQSEIDDDEYSINTIEKTIETDDENSKESSKNEQKEYEKKVQKALDTLYSSPENYLDIKNIGKYSPKFKKIIERINSLNGTALVYSQFRKVEGLGILGLSLKANGYCEFKIKKHKDEWEIDMAKEDYNKPKYIEFTGNNEQTQVLLKIFNSDIDNIPSKIKDKLALLSTDGNTTNIRGSIIKVLMITQSGAEGISLKNVRQVHVVEPYWNYIRIDQVVGRAVRTCSHVDLPMADRNVKVFIYNMVFKPEQLEQSFTIKTQDNSLTSDEHIYGIAKKKAKIINMMLDLVKQASVDCALNAKSHSNMRCFSFPVNLNSMELTYKSDMKDELFDYQYVKDIETKEWYGEVLITKKGNFLIRPDTNEVYDYDLYLESGKLVKIGILRIVDNKKLIVKK